MAQTHRLGKGNTTVTADNGFMVVRFHWTDVVKFSDKKIILNSGGWKTVTTKTRMNQASNQFGLGYSVSQKDGVWSVSYRGKTVPFADEMTLKR